MFPALFPLFLILFFFTSSPVCAQPGKFIPKITYYRGDLAVEFYDETDNEKFDKRETDRKETILLEKITLTAFGFVYHPRFIVFRGSLTGSAVQGTFEYSTVDGDGSWDMNQSLGYDFRMLVLPEHPYNLEIHSSRIASVNRGVIITGEGTIPVYETHGISFEYKQKPYFASLSYDKTKTEAFDSTTDGDRYNISGSYILGITNTYGSYSRTENDISSPGYGADNTNDVYTLYNRTEYKQYRLTSRLEQSTYSQTASNDTSLDTDRFYWSEFLEIDLPWNFRTELMASRTEFDTETENGKNSSTTDSAVGRISHRLFRTLDTSYSLEYNKITYDAGDSRRWSQVFSLFYNKQIPWGSMLAGVNLGLSNNERSGIAVTSREVYSAPLFSEILLRSANIDAILSVDVKDSDTGLFFRLQEEDYLVTHVGTMTIITVLSVPDLVVEPDPLYTYEFQISYTIKQEDLEVREKNAGFSLNMTLFDGMVSPFYSHTIFKQELLSGTLGFNPTERTTDTIGVTLRRQPFTLRLQYEDSESDIDTRKTTRAELLFDHALSRTLTVFGTSNYYVDEYESSGASTKYVETGAGVGFRKYFTRTKMNFSSSVHYTLRSGDSDGYAYNFNSHLSWNIRRTNLVLGATISYSENESSFNRYERDYQYIYLKLKRQIF